MFVGYENEDWYIPSPALKPEEVDLNLTPDQIRETLNYFRKYSEFCLLSSLSSAPLVPFDEV
jgi:hypothetical protein